MESVAGGRGVDRRECEAGRMEQKRSNCCTCTLAGQSYTRCGPGRRGRAADEASSGGDEWARSTYWTKGRRESEGTGERKVQKQKTKKAVGLGEAAAAGRSVSLVVGFLKTTGIDVLSMLRLASATSHVHNSLFS
jgi:hypothetical protein